MAERRRGRGRLSSLEQLPEEASDIVVWAARELDERKRTQTDIYAEFKTRLIALQGEQGLAFDIPSFSAFNRYSLGQAELTMQLTETRQIASAVAERLDGVGNEEVTTVAIETLKVLVLNIARAKRGNASAKEAMEMARALNSLVSTSKMSAAQKQRFQEEMAAAANEAIDKAAVAAREAGVSAERIAQMRREFLGVRQTESQPVRQ
jgi:hypothetical protein